ncbi:MAG: hypothetical protein EAZ90_21440 [Oscillatoriales cyanobacterium]|nr:MAG: hypothetical protein EAZ90_21440 [Oscillatoriales cyanobacterium]TAE54493.1 MAG: hypothetical protein EAZ88_08935 [Oscillatoriales cyanobacterium]TAE65912.1 MAG: hypothetical protein EAZ86_22490 [Oscillatoriales cyanobacterium]TAF89518.1 MAG: hypothetical protein EAZ49_12640 [Oscillatoriales cyanobacterium]TAG05253.1 MAG: hypothetical protein EAZ45_06265 [Oscillatoriales cyanobacterium]
MGIGHGALGIGHGALGIGHWVNGIWRIKAGEGHSRLHRRNPPPRVEERAKGIRAYMNKTGRKWVGIN